MTKNNKTQKNNYKKTKGAQMKKVCCLAGAIAAATMANSALALDIAEVNGTQFSIGGFFKAEGIYSSPDNGDKEFDGNVRTSRINFSASNEVEGHKVRGFVETDFWDNNTSADSTYAQRLRHAYISIDKVTIGQTWNGQFFSTAPMDAQVLDFWGPGFGTIAGNGAVVRPDLVMHYRSGGLLVTLQEPVYEDADLPDMVVSYTQRYAGGHGFTAAVTGRDVEIQGTDNSEFGAAFSLAGKVALGSATTLHLSGYTGEGAAVYAGYGYNGSAGGGTRDDNGVDLIKTRGFSVAVVHKLSDKLTGTVRYGEAHADEIAAGVADDTSKMTDVNLVYTFLPNVDLGVEWRDMSATSRPAVFAEGSQREAGQQFEVMAKLKF